MEEGLHVGEPDLVIVAVDESEHDADWEHDKETEDGEIEAVAAE
jgi:hypothetical protein